MNVLHIDARVEAIRAVAAAGDAEAAHSMEDTLYRDVLIDLAEYGMGYHVFLARAALKSQDFDFRRWTA